MKKLFLILSVLSLSLGVDMKCRMAPTAQRGR